MKLCRNSVVSIDRTAGTGNWTLPANLNYVKYVNTSTTSEFNSTSTPADIYPTNNTAGYYNLQSGSVVFNSYLDLESDARPLPIIGVTATDGSALTSNQICVGGSVKVSNTAAAFGTNLEFKWEVYSGSSAPTKASSPGSTIFSSTLASPTFGPFTTAGTYIVRMQIREQCCGWSIPVFATITVNGDPSAPTDISFSLPLSGASICEGSTITVSGASGSTLGVPSYTYEYDYSNTTRCHLR
jgi:hypothetical protein